MLKERSVFFSPALPQYLGIFRDRAIGLTYNDRRQNSGLPQEIP
jgi:hypothetical protein